MSYCDLNLKKVKSNFNLEIIENDDLFSSLNVVKISPLLNKILKQNVPLSLAMGTEKASSELIIVNIFLELKRQFNISFFSGIEFTVDKEQGLNGFCDFIISKSSEQLFLESPIITLVEAKNEKIVSGLGQCIAEMLAARIYNEKENQSTPFIYGIVTTGHAWKFLKLDANKIYIDIEDYYIKTPEKILAILSYMVKH
jgi:hypothetical protein